MLQRKGAGSASPVRCAGSCAKGFVVGRLVDQTVPKLSSNAQVHEPGFSVSAFTHNPHGAVDEASLLQTHLVNYRSRLPPKMYGGNDAVRVLLFGVSRDLKRPVILSDPGTKPGQFLRVF